MRSGFALSSALYFHAAATWMLTSTYLEDRLCADTFFFFFFFKPMTEFSLSYFAS